MMTVKEASRLTGISIRTLQYYDKLGLLPAMRTESGYRLYDDAALERLQQILLFRELEFPLRDIRTILDNPNFDRRKALRQQIELLTLKKQHLEDLIRLARTLQVAGGHTMQFKEFDTSRIDEYTRRAKESWGDTPAYREFEQNAAERTVQESSDINNQLMALTAGFGALQNLPIDNPAVQAQAAKLQAFITEHYYTCTKEIFARLGQMYGAGGEFTANINAAGGPGTAEFAAKAIEVYCEE